MKLKLIGFGIAVLLMTACGNDDKKTEDATDSTATEQSYVPPIGNETPNTTNTPAQTNEPDVIAQNSPQNPVTMPTKEITDAEITKLSKIINQLQQLNMQSQQMMMQAVEKQGLPVQRFMAIQQGSQNPEVAKTITPDEQKKFQASVSELGKIQVEMRKKMENVLKKEGVTMQEYQQMMISIQTNPAAQQKLMQLSAPQTPPVTK